MGKIVFWILVVLAVMLLFRQLGPRKAVRRRGAAAGGGAEGDGQEQLPTHDVMLACTICDLHLPASEAIFSGGKVYCCEAHRDQGRALLGQDRDAG